MRNFTSGKRFLPKTSKGTTAVLLLAFLLTFVFLAPSPAKGVVEKDAFLVPKTFSKLAEEASPAVVNIRTVKTIKGGGQVFRHFMRPPMGPNDPFNDFFEKFFGDEQQREFKQRSLGSGFIIDKEGYIVTNNHVIEDADEIRVQLRNEKEYDAEIVGRDPNTDIALIKIKGPKDLPVLKLGDSDALKVGEWVVAIGNPFGLDHTVTAGIVSAKGRVIGAGPYDDFIQTDASINPGNSGGPLLNLNGEVIGINTAIVASGQGIGFAIPINMALGIVEQLRQKGEVTRGWLGVGIQDVKGEVAEYYGLKEGEGVLVAQVFPGDPAEKAGIQPQDIILEVNEKKVGSSRELSRLIADIGVGEEARIKLLRNGKEEIITVTIAKREDTRVTAEKPRNETESQIGIQVADLTPEMANRLNLPETQGVVVVDVASGSKAEAAGIIQGDVIKEINHMPTHSVKAFKEAFDKVKTGETFQMFILRGNMGFLVVKMTK
ncbi:MAG: DegQ family serine endoprotease [Deltaproteobacteria bacterium]|nr:DegQ family serine endoprotease [Deltaproteobacteria bacterium]